MNPGQNKDFEVEVAQTSWKDLSDKMFYTWDGNHQLSAWMGVLQRCELHKPTVLLENATRLTRSSLCFYSCSI